MIIEVVKEFTFDSAHYLPKHPGKCKECHGHRWALQVGFEGEVNPETGMVIDFGDVKRAVQPLIIDKLDHKLLNEIDLDMDAYGQPVLSEDMTAPIAPMFPNYAPTAENIIGWIIHVLKAQSFQWPGARLSLVRLYESPTSYAEWRADKNAAD